MAKKVTTLQRPLRSPYGNLNADYTDENDNAWPSVQAYLDSVAARHGAVPKRMVILVDIDGVETEMTNRGQESTSVFVPADRDGGISDAPSDGKAYVRKDEEWVEGEVITYNKTSILNSILANKIDGKYIAGTTGRIFDAPTSWPEYFYSDLFSITKGQVIEIVSKDPSGSAISKLSKWSSDGQKFKETIYKGTASVTTVTYTAEEDVEYLRFCGLNRQDYTESISLIDAVIPEILTDSFATKEEIKVLHTDYENVDIEIVDGYYINSQGRLLALNTYGYSRPILCHRGDIIVAKVNGTKNASAAIATCTSENSSAFSIRVLADETSVLKEYTYTLTEDAYVSISGNKVSLSLKRKELPIASKLVNLQEGVDSLNIEKVSEKWAFSAWKILCIGDSLTSGASYQEEWGEQTSPGASIDQNYPRMLSRMLGAEVTNSGYSGYSASTWYTNKVGSYDYSDYDTFVIWLGTNNGLTDTLEEDVNAYGNPENFATTETGYYCKIIEAIKGQNSSCVIILCTIFASKGSVSTTNAVIEQIAQKYDLLVIDNSDLGTSNHPELHAGVNNVHFGKAGNIFVADRIIKKMSQWLNEDPLRCEFGYSPRTN